jgi:hypothetical protein
MIKSKVQRERREIISEFYGKGTKLEKRMTERKINKKDKRMKEEENRMGEERKTDGSTKRIVRKRKERVQNSRVKNMKEN